MKKILSLSALILLAAACSQPAMQGGMMTSDQCMQKQHMHQECMKKMQGQGMMQKQGDMMKDCPMMKQMMMQQNMGNAQPATPATTPSAEEHKQHHPQ